MDIPDVDWGGDAVTSSGSLTGAIPLVSVLLFSGWCCRL